ncbi:MAG TPA: hypothetical protein VGG45_11340 [Terracidiphilus sp.]|jgi:hypothetical protein
MPDHEIRLFGADGTLSITMVLGGTSQYEAELQALAMLKGDIARAEIWADLDLVKTVTLPAGEN